MDILLILLFVLVTFMGVKLYRLSQNHTRLEGDVFRYSTSLRAALQACEIMQKEQEDTVKALSLLAKNQSQMHKQLIDFQEDMVDFVSLVAEQISPTLSPKKEVITKTASSSLFPPAKKGDKSKPD
jgi:hypothetical protein